MLPCAALPLDIERDVPLAPLTTFELGGPARHFATVRSDGDVADALAWAGERGLSVHVLGGGSNLVVADEGFDGLVVRVASKGVEIDASGRVAAAAGEPWDELVAECVRRRLAGIECLSGIPGLVGATPIQNVGAYGQEVADTLVSVRALDRRTGRVETLAPSDCAFSYRDSAFKRSPDRWIVLGVELALVPGGAPAIRYAELERSLAPLDKDTILRSVAKTKRAIVLDEGPMLGGISAEIAAMVQENLFSDLKGPVVRIGAQPIPPPHSPPLVDAMIPDADQVVDAVMRLAEGGRPT